MHTPKWDGDEPGDPQFESGRVLVVEDDWDTCENLQDALELDGYEVTCVGTLSALQAREDLGGFSFVLLDRQLPDGRVDDALPWLRERVPHASILVVTGDADLNGAVAAVRHGVADFVLKPVQMEALLLRLRSLARQRRRDEEYRQGQRLASIGTMVSSVSHEARNELHALALGLQMLEDDLQDQPGAAGRVRTLRACERRLWRLFDDLRGFAGPLRLEWSLCRLTEAWRRAWSSLEDVHRGRGVELLEEVEHAGLEVPADRFRMEQVFRNLLENALSICPDPLRIVIRCGFDESGEEPAVRVSVRDNGPGLGEEARRRLFEAFYTRRPGGTGLGLAICRRILEAHGGSIEAGDAGDGAEFVLRMPVRPYLPVEGVEVVEEGAATGPGRAASVCSGVPD